MESKEEQPEQHKAGDVGDGERDMLDLAPVESHRLIGVDAIPESLRSVVGTEVAIIERDDTEPSKRLNLGAVEPQAAAFSKSGGDQPHSVGRGERPTYFFFGIVAALTLISDISTKVWAEMVINQRGFEPIRIIGENVSVTLAYNQGGAWGLFSNAEEMIRKPFFLGVSGFAVFFIISLYSRLHSSQIALKWGLPLVLGGALGNLSDRITRSQVIDFIDYRADWVMSVNVFVKKYVSSWTVTDHWPTFNVADVAICIGVILMAVDMFSHHPRARRDDKVPLEIDLEGPEGAQDSLGASPASEGSMVSDESAISEASAISEGSAILKSATSEDSAASEDSSRGKDPGKPGASASPRDPGTSAVSGDAEKFAAAIPS